VQDRESGFEVLKLAGLSRPGQRGWVRWSTASAEMLQNVDFSLGIFVPEMSRAGKCNLKKGGGNHGEQGNNYTEGF